jgi:hypothetical protein
VFSLDDIPGVKTSKGLKELLADEANLSRLKSLGFTKLVLLSESPVRFAVQASNPGSQRTRIYYPESVSPSVDAWPVLYRSEDVLIRAIPERPPGRHRKSAQATLRHVLQVLTVAAKPHT